MSDSKTVDLTVLRAVHDRALRRMELLQAEERAHLGVAKSSLSVVARNALLSYDGRLLREPLGVPVVAPRGTWEERHWSFRFQMSRAAYERAAALIADYGYDVTAVVHDALATFARTGVVPKLPALP